MLILIQNKRKKLHNTIFVPGESALKSYYIAARMCAHSTAAEAKRLMQSIAVYNLINPETASGHRRIWLNSCHEERYSLVGHSESIVCADGMLGIHNRHRILLIDPGIIQLSATDGLSYQLITVLDRGLTIYNDSRRLPIRQCPANN